MKLTIELTPNEVDGIKKYLFDTSGDNKRATTADVKQYIAGIVSGVLYSPHEAVSDYITEANKH